MKRIIFSVCVMIFSYGAVAGPFYNVGQNAAIGLAESTWDNLGRNCRNIDTFAEIVEDGIRDAARDIEIRYRGHSAKDFGAGYQAGLSRALNKVRDRCESRRVRRLLARLERLVKKLFKLVIAGGTLYEEPEPYEEHEYYPVPPRPYGGGEHYPVPPRPYYGGGEQSIYRIAYNAASDLVRSTWDRLDRECMRTSQFVRRVGYGVDDATADIGTRYTGWAAEEFGQGYIDGLVESLERLVNRCVNECGRLGNAMGEWSAKMYCRVAQEIRRAPRFTSRIANLRGSMCGNAYKSGCESGFFGTARWMCPRYTGSSRFRDYCRVESNLY